MGRRRGGRKTRRIDRMVGVSAQKSAGLPGHGELEKPLLMTGQCEAGDPGTNWGGARPSLGARRGRVHFGPMLKKGRGAPVEGGKREARPGRETQGRRVGDRGERLTGTRHQRTRNARGAHTLRTALWRRRKNRTRDSTKDSTGFLFNRARVLKDLGAFGGT